MATEKSITAKVKAGAPKNSARFKFLSGNMAGQEVPISRDVFFIGRSGNNNMVLDDRSVSRKQAVLNCVDNKFVLSDLKSFKGTFVNGKKIQEVELKNGDRIKMGSAVVEFIEGKMPTRSRKWLILPVLLAIALVAGLMVFLAKPEKKVGAELNRQIEFNFSQGVKAYNVDKDVESAKKYWQKVIELDVKNETIQSRKARILLDSLK